MVARKHGAPPEASAQQRMWTAMRIHRAFENADVATSATVSINTAKTFIRRLILAGYIIRRNPKTHCQGGTRAAYVLVRDTGPVAPRALSDGTAFDVNTQQIVRKDGSTDDRNRDRNMGHR